MTSSATCDGPTKNRYRLPGIEREGIAQLSLLETGVWPLDGTRGPAFATQYAFTTSHGAKTADVTVRSALGLKPIDEYVLWGLLGATLSRPEAESVLLATPYWMLKRLALQTGGTQYAELRESLLRLTTTSYQNTGFYNPETQEHEYVSFQFLSMLLPTVGGAGGEVDNDRCWRIEWNPAFFRFSRLTGGSLLFDLDLYQRLTPASRRLFLKLKDRFWRTKRVFLNVDDLTIHGLGFSASRPLFKRKFDLTNCLRELLEYRIIELGRGQTDVRELFLKRSKGCYVVVCYQGDYFRQPLAGRTVGQQNAIMTDPLFEPLRKVGLEAAAIRRLFEQSSRGRIQQWLTITEAAMHEQPRGFPGFKVSPAAFLVDGLQNNRMPPDWMHAHEKRQRELEWERERIAVANAEAELRPRYDAARRAACQTYLGSVEGQQHYQQTLPAMLALKQRTDPLRAEEVARSEALAYVEQHWFQFPEFDIWKMGLTQSIH